MQQQREFPFQQEQQQKDWLNSTPEDVSWNFFNGVFGSRWSHELEFTLKILDRKKNSPDHIAMGNLLYTL